MLTVVYFNRGYLKVSDLFGEMKTLLDELYRRYINIDDIVFYEEENFWCAKVYYYEKDNR